MKILLLTILLSLSFSAHAGWATLIECQTVQHGFNTTYIGTYQYQGQIFQRAFRNQCPMGIGV